MAADPHPAATSRAPVSVTQADGCAVLHFTGALSADAVLELERQLLDPRLYQARTWVMDMSDLTRMDLICALALRRAATRLPATTTVTVREARRNVRRTLRHVGLEVLAVFEE